jgi:hypothetical protein
MHERPNQSRCQYIYARSVAGERLLSVLQLGQEHPFEGVVCGGQRSAVYYKSISYKRITARLEYVPSQQQFHCF